MSESKYILKSQIVTVPVRGQEITFEENISIDPETLEEVYVRSVGVENNRRLFDAYKRLNGLLTGDEIKAIWDQYQLNQKEYALALGLGEITIHRYENGTIQTDSVDAMIRLSNVPKNMKLLLQKNKGKFTTERFTQIQEIINELDTLSSHQIAEVDHDALSALPFETSHVEHVSERVIELYNNRAKTLEEKYNTPLPKATVPLLNSLLYYIQGLSFAVYQHPAFHQDLIAWRSGPISIEIHRIYKESLKSEITTDSPPQLSKGLDAMVHLVIESYGSFPPGKLIALTREEDPWKKTPQNGVIKPELIREYFEKVYRI